MNIILSTLNAKFIHSSLALRCLKKSAGIYKNNISVIEYSINNSLSRITAELYRLKPDVLCFSCYIWNIEEIKIILSSLKKVLPHTFFVLGGPEATFQHENLLNLNLCDIVILGEGEETFRELAGYFSSEKFLSEKSLNINSLNSIKGLAYKNEQAVVLTAERPPLDLDDLPFVYEDGFEGLENKIIYYESSRGCPFSCSYCLSSINREVRFLSLERLLPELKFFLEHSVSQVKFVDRSFNCDLPRAKKIWQFLIDLDNRVTNFHFEIHAALLDDEAIQVLSKARPGLFQFEIGVQSTNPATLKAINRRADQEKLFRAVRELKKLANIHLHLDLIAGLPLEDLPSFEKSFNEVYSLEPSQLQLGFLKVLKGSPIEKELELYGLVHEDKPPYTVLFNQSLSYDELLVLKDIEEALDVFYNSGKFFFTLNFLMRAESNAFRFYSDLSQYLEASNFFSAAHNTRALYRLFFNFCAKRRPEKISVIKEILIFDIYFNEQAKSLPDFAEEQNLSHMIKEFYSEPQNAAYCPAHLTSCTPKQLSRLCRLRQFPYDIMKLISAGEIFERDCFIMFTPAKPTGTGSFFFEITP